MRVSFCSGTIILALAFAGVAQSAEVPVAPAATAPALAVAPVSVGNGYFLADHCVSEADPKVMNECICKAAITKGQVSGLPPKVATTINNQLSQLPERLASESCSGKSTAAPDANVQVNMASANFETLYQSPTILSMLITFSTAGAGAAHPIPGSEGYIFNLNDGKTLDIASLLTADQLAKANDFLRQELRKKYADTMLEEARNHTGPYLSDAGCENCTLYYTKDGWIARFAVYSIAPYALGEPSITIPTTIIPEPETLIARKK
jgi:hypothetical protein